jgi:hypothetical protein
LLISTGLSILFSRLRATIPCLAGLKRQALSSFREFALALLPAPILIAFSLGKQPRKTKLPIKTR